MTEEFHYVGKGVLPKDGVEVVTGKAVFTDDIKLGNMLYVKMLRSPHQHAKIKGIDTTKAEALPGVGAVVSYQDIYKYIPKTPMLDGALIDSETLYPLDDEVFYAGEEMAAVAAESEEIAEEALDLIEVEYEVLPGIFDAEEAAREGAPLVNSRRDNNLVGYWDIQDMVWGDVEQGRREAEITVEGKYVPSVETHASLETNCVICQWDGDKLVVHATTQQPCKTQMRIAKALGIPENKVWVLSPRLGGGFGGKASQNTESRLGVILAVLAKKSGRPVKMRLTMAEKLACVATRYPTVGYVKAGAKKDGSPSLLEGRLIINEGAHAALHGMSEGPALCRFDTYSFPHRDIHAQSVFTNKVQSCPMRPLMGCEGFWISETLLDELAEKLGEDPVEFRAENIIRGGDKVFAFFAYPNGEALLPGGDAPLMLRMAAERFGWEARWKGWGKTVEINGPKVRSIGMAVGQTLASGQFTDTVVIKVNTDGSVTVGGGSPEMGQGISTALSQVVAEALGVSPDKVIYVTDTQTSGFCMGGASAQRGTPLTIGAAKLAAEDAKRQLLALAAPMLETKSEELDMLGGMAFVKAVPERRMSIPSILFDLGSYRTVVGTGYAQAGYYARDPVKGLPLEERSFHVGFAEVEVDTETGEVSVLRVVEGMECGRVLNPRIVEQQMDGGLVMGLHYALTEGIIFDKGNGAVLNTSLTDYKLPTILDVPPIDNVISNDPAHAPTCIPYNAKGCSEGPETYVAPMLLNAVYNAIGVRIHEGPLTPDNVLKALGKVKPGG